MLCIIYILIFLYPYNDIITIYIFYNNLYLLIIIMVLWYYNIIDLIYYNIIDLIDYNIVIITL